MDKKPRAAASWIAEPPWIKGSGKGFTIGREKEDKRHSRIILDDIARFNTDPRFTVIDVFTRIFAIIPTLAMLLIGVHLVLTFWDVFDAAETRLEYSLAQQRREFCRDVTRVASLGFGQACDKSRPWIERPYTLNVLRLSIDAHIDHMMAMWIAVFGWLTHWDPFTSFQIKQLVNSVCTNVVVAMPFVFGSALVFVGLLLRGPIAEFRAAAFGANGATVARQRRRRRHRRADRRLSAVSVQHVD